MLQIGNKMKSLLPLLVVLCMTTCWICTESAAGLPPQVVGRECRQTRWAASRRLRSGSGGFLLTTSFICTSLALAGTPLGR